MKLPGAGGQTAFHPLYDASGTITAGGTAQLILGLSASRTHLIIGNNSSSPMYVEFGSARATCTISSGAVNAVTVTNAGMKFSAPPQVFFVGGGNTGQNSTYLGVPQPNSVAPGNTAQAHCVMAGSAPNQTVSSIVIDNPGSGYSVAPGVFLVNNPVDPNGCAAPASNVGILLPAGSAPLVWNGSVCPVEQFAIWCNTTGAAYTVKWMD